MMRLQRKDILGLALSLALGLMLAAAPLLHPRENTVVPAHRLRVFDEAGNPAGGVVVKQEWEYVAVGSEGHAEYSRTDADGYVAFPQRSEGVSLLRKGLSALRELANPMHGHGMGPTGAVWAYGADPRVWTYEACEVGTPAPQELRMKRSGTTMRP